MEIKHCVGITCEGFEEGFLALLTSIEAGYAQFKADPSHNLAKKRKRELERLTWAMNDDEGERSSSRGSLKGRATTVPI